MARSRGQRRVRVGYSVPATGSDQPLSEFDGYVSGPIRSHHPGGRHVPIWTHDVGVVFGAPHEHAVEPRIGDAAAPVADVLTRLSAEAAAQVDARPVRVIRLCPALPREPLGIRHGHRVKTVAPAERPQAGRSAIAVDELL